MTRVIINLLGFQAVWTATVWGAANGMVWLGLAGFAGFAAWQLAVSATRTADARLMLAVTPLGWLLDSGYVAAGLLEFARPWPGEPLAPWWIALMWANFTLVINHSLAWLGRRTLLAAAFGAVGGPLAYAAAQVLGAVDLGDNRGLTLAVLAAAWGAAVPAIYWLNRALTPRGRNLEAHP